MLNRNAIFRIVLLQALRFLLAFYKVVLSPIMGGACRFEPSCSEYAEQALDRVGNDLSWTEAIRLIGSRLLRCHPWGSFGPDPLPRTANNFAVKGKF